MKPKHVLLVLLLLSFMLVGCRGGTGTVVIETTPPGANVFIGSRFVSTTPSLLSDVPEGTTKITLRKEGYYDKPIKIVVRANEESIVYEELIPSIETLRREIQVSSTPYSPGVAYLIFIYDTMELDPSDIWAPTLMKMPLFGDMMKYFVQDLKERPELQETYKDAHEERERMGVVALPKLWDVRMLDENTALVRNNRIDVFAPHLTLRLDGKWWLLRPLYQHEDFDTVSVDELVENTNVWIKSITDELTVLYKELGIWTGD